MNPAPVALFAYQRADHLARTVTALQMNHGASTTDLVIFSDAPKNSAAEAGVAEVRRYASTIRGFQSVQIFNRPQNFGLAKSIIDGVTTVLTTRDRVIVLEDDMVTSPYFLRYLNDGLSRFAEEERVASIHAYTLPTRNQLPEAFFLRGADCWGWGTWARAWRNFNPDGQALLREFQARNLVREFDLDSRFPYSDMLKDQIAGRNDSWAIRWHASAFLANLLTLHPGRSLVRNIGNDGSGTHCGTTSQFDVALSSTPIDLSGVDVMPSKTAYSEYRDFLGRVHGGPLKRTLRNLRNALLRRRQP